jgi:regulator of sigma E protease
MVQVKFTPFEALKQSFIEPFRFIVFNLKGLGMIFSGGLDVRENVSGPIRIAKIAGDVAYYKGILAFIVLMAKISIILMIMNLLPIPAVDGSHIVFYTIEAIRGKPLKEEIMVRIQTGGILILIIIGVLVIFNDILMLPFVQKLLN